MLVMTLPIRRALLRLHITAPLGAIRATATLVRLRLGVAALGTTRPLAHEMPTLDTAGRRRHIPLIDLGYAYPFALRYLSVAIYLSYSLV